MSSKPLRVACLAEADEVIELSSGRPAREWVHGVTSQQIRAGRWRLAETWGGRVLAICVVLAVWQAMSSFNIVKPILISSPYLTGRDLGAWITQKSTWNDVRVTLVEMLLGLIIGTLLGILLGLCVGARRRLSKAVEPFAVAVHTVPVVVLVPLFLLWFGFGLGPKVLVVALSVFFVMFFNTLTGVREINRLLIFSMRLMQCSTFSIVRQVYLPSIVSWVFVALRSAIAYALVGAVVSEFVAANAGLGYAMDNASLFLDVPRVFSVLIVLTTLGIVLVAVSDLIGRWLLRWR